LEYNEFLALSFLAHPTPPMPGRLTQPEKKRQQDRNQEDAAKNRVFFILEKFCLQQLVFLWLDRWAMVFFLSCLSSDKKIHHRGAENTEGLFVEIKSEARC
jgi:hypothetical protein